jgi:hypothetical protein
MRRSTLTLLSVALASSTLVACGDDTSKTASAEREKSSPAVARREAGETRQALVAALAAYKNGDKAAAQEQVAEAYVRHFEEVEGRLDKLDHELNEHLEEAISGELRQLIRQGKPAAEVTSAFGAVIADLRKAEALLR